MRILIAATLTPYGNNEEKALAIKLEEEVKARGNETDCVFLPHVPEVLSLPEQIVHLRALDVSGCDRLITVGFPACFLNHPQKSICLFDRAPMLYEYWDTEYGTIGTPQYGAILRSMYEAERRCYAGATQLICGSQLLRADILSGTGAAFQVRALSEFAVPTVDGSADGGGYLVWQGSLHPCARVEMMLDALSKCPGVALRLYVQDSHPVYREALTVRAKQLELSEDRLQIFDREMSDAEMTRCAAYLDVGVQRRRQSMPLIRAAKLGVPLILTGDGGAPLELRGRYEGIVTVAADSVQIAGKMQQKATASSERYRGMRLNPVDEILEGWVD